MERRESTGRIIERIKEMYGETENFVRIGEIMT